MIAQATPTRIALLWLLLFIGYIIHGYYPLAQLFFEKSITPLHATRIAPISTLIINTLIHLPIVLIALFSLYITHKKFYRFSFICSLSLSILTSIQLIKTISTNCTNYSQIVPHLALLIVTVLLCHTLHHLATPWQILPLWLRHWSWAKHQQRWFGKWHLYLGLFAGSILVIIGLTGSILVFQDEIDTALNPKFFEVLRKKEKIPLQNAIIAVQKKYPNKTFNYVSITNHNQPTATYQFRDLEKQTEFFINPYTLENCGKRLTHSSFIRIIMNIHMTLLLPGIGQYITGLSALCMLILTITGLRLWIPNNIKKWKQWKDALTIKFGASFKRQNLDWHNVLGFYSAPIIIVLSLTGFIITFTSVFLTVLFMLNGKTVTDLQNVYNTPSLNHKNLTTIPITKATQIVQNQFPKAQLEAIMLPSDKKSSYQFYLRNHGNAKTGNLIMITTNQYSGKILSNSEQNIPKIAKSYLNWTTPLHYGTFGGWPTRILAFLGGLIPLALYITGIIIWWPRYKKQKNQTTQHPKTTKQTNTKLKPEQQKTQQYPLKKYIIHHTKKGLLYGLYLLISSALSGLLYGITSGIIIAPALYMVLYIGIAILLNALIAVAVLLFQILFLLPFKKSYRILYKYTTLSLALLLVFTPAIYIINNHLSKHFL